MLFRSTLYVCLSAAFAVLAGPPNGRPLGDSKIFASVGFPGYPEGIAVQEGRVYISRPAAFGVPGNAQPSKIFVYDVHTGALVDTIVARNQPGPMNAISCIAFGEENMLYVADESSASILGINVKTRRQSTYAGPFTPVFQSIYNPAAPFLLNDLAFEIRKATSM